MEIRFKKYSATGNDFIMIDNRGLKWSAENATLWKTLCERRKHIGADGVLLVEPSERCDFKMRYINADGSEVEMCGNGARAISKFYAELLPFKKNSFHFETMHGRYYSEIRPETIRLNMTELKDIEKYDISPLLNSAHALYLNTGVPHCVYEVDNVECFDIIEHGRKIRFNPLFEHGTNVNFFTVIGTNKIRIRTYERGVEDETLSCGTGITATAIACKKFFNWKKNIDVETRGGKLTVEFNDDLSSIYLSGEVNEIYSATTDI